MQIPRVGVIMGSDSDLPLMQEALTILDSFAIAYEVHISSAHRTPARTAQFSKTARDRGIEVIIAGAGWAAHLAGVIAAETTLPVIGVPIDSSSLNGLDALLSMVQMPGGVPVAAMTIGKAGAKNAALFAAQILALKYPELQQKLLAYKQALAAEVEAKDAALQQKLAQK
jgi:phosphoribosylaminoimidazole carboxylase PurE protein